MSALIRCTFSFQCPQLWRNLSPTTEVDVRHCGVCERDVHLVGSEQEFRDQVARGNCVAVPLQLTRPKAVVIDRQAQDEHMIGRVTSGYGPE